MTWLRNVQMLETMIAARRLSEPEHWSAAEEEEEGAVLKKRKEAGVRRQFVALGEAYGQRPGSTHGGPFEAGMGASYLREAAHAHPQTRFGEVLQLDATAT